MSMNKAPFVFVSGTCKFSIHVDGEDTEFRGYFAGRYQTADDLGIFGGDDFKVFHGALFDEAGECCGTVEWTEKQFREYVVSRNHRGGFSFHVLQRRTMK